MDRSVSMQESKDGRKSSRRLDCPRKTTLAILNSVTFSDSGVCDPALRTHRISRSLKQEVRRFPCPPVQIPEWWSSETHLWPKLFVIPWEHTRRSVLSFKMGGRDAPSFFKRGNRGFAGDGWVLVKKLIDGFSPFQIIGQRLEWNSGSAKHGFAAENCRIFDDYRFHRIEPAMICSYSSSASPSVASRIIARWLSFIRVAFLTGQAGSAPR